MIRLTIAIIFLLLSFNDSAAQGIIGIKTNVLYGGVAFTPNIGVETGLGKRTTLDIAAGYNPWNVKGSNDGNKVLSESH